MADPGEIRLTLMMGPQIAVPVRQEVTDALLSAQELGLEVQEVLVEKVDRVADAVMNGPGKVRNDDVGS